jgi:hypothetical protein
LSSTQQRSRQHCRCCHRRHAAASTQCNSAAGGDGLCLVNFCGMGGQRGRETGMKVCPCNWLVGGHSANNGLLASCLVRHAVASPGSSAETRGKIEPTPPPSPAPHRRPHKPVTHSITRCSAP